MRFLKNKIALAKTLQVSNRAKIVKPNLETKNCSPSKGSSDQLARKKRHRVPGQSLIPQSSRAVKNIAKNYGRKICAFAISSLALPYLQNFVEKEEVQLSGFINYIHQIKGDINGLFHFRSILLENKNDSIPLKAYKRIFKAISEVFIKYFSVNWIFHSKVFHKDAHLKFRYKMLRRIQRPELFTYMKDSPKEKIMKQ